MTTGAGEAARDELRATLHHRAGSTGPKALLEAAGGSGAHERHCCKGQWLWMAWCRTVSCSWRQTAGDFRIGGRRCWELEAPPEVKSLCFVR